MCFRQRLGWGARLDGKLIAGEFEDVVEARDGKDVLSGLRNIAENQMSFAFLEQLPQAEQAHDSLAGQNVNLAKIDHHAAAAFTSNGLSNDIELFQVFRSRRQIDSDNMVVFIEIAHF